MKPTGFRLTLRRLMVMITVIAVYLTIYRGLVYRDIFRSSARHPEQVEEHYGHMDRFCSFVFEPANRLDRMLRPWYWSMPTSIY